MPAHPTPRPAYHCECGDHSWAAVTKGYVTLVSRVDAYLLQGRAWSAAPRSRTIYAQANFRPHRQYLHKLILCTTPAFPEIDHINRNGLDNRRSNLRIAARRENARNTRSRPGTSRFKGVHKANKGGGWAAQITKDGKCIHLGTFPSEESAANAYDAAASRLFAEHALLNRGGQQ